MGTPSPKNEPGNLCEWCWGLGKMFGDTPTPRFISVALTKMLPGEFWNPEHEQLLLTTHDLEQTGFSCVWEISDGLYRWGLNYTQVNTFFEVHRISDNKEVFVDDYPDPCLTDIPSALSVPDDHVAFGGFANFYWNVEDL